MKNYFGVMLDMSRNSVMKVEEVKKFVDYISSFGYNMLQLYTEDTFEVDGEPYFGYMRGRYTKYELKELDSYCANKNVELVPCVQTLAHLNCIFKWAPYTEIRDLNDILLVDEERTYRLIDNIFSALEECFSSRLVNIGMDEAHMLGLGRYLSYHGYEKRYDILKKHLSRVLEITDKHGFKPMMWSDMFFRPCNGGEYYSRNPVVTKEAIDSAPKNVSLVFWDYYHDEKSVYTAMLKAHKKFNNEIWFAGGAKSWYGLTPKNIESIRLMKPAMEACKEEGIRNIFITLWGDNGGECSYFSLLPALFKIKELYQGEEDEKIVKNEFYSLTGENFDDMLLLDSANNIGDAIREGNNPSKYMLFEDPFLNFLDSSVEDDYSECYKRYAENLRLASERSKNFGYLYKLQADLCDVLSVKFSLGIRTRCLYDKKDRDGLKTLLSDYNSVIIKAEKLYDSFKIAWDKENKPFGFEVQDARFGGLMLRLKHCKERLEDYICGNVKNIPELEEKLMDFFGKENKLEKRFICYNNWNEIISPGTV